MHVSSIGPCTRSRHDNNINGPVTAYSMERERPIRHLAMPGHSASIDKSNAGLENEHAQPLAEQQGTN